MRGRPIHSKPHLSRKRLREVPTAPHHAQLQHITVLYRYRCVNSQILTPRSGELTAVRPFGRHVNAAPWHVSGDDHQRDTTGAPWPHQQLRHQELANGGEVLLKVRLASSKPPLSQWARSSKARAVSGICLSAASRLVPCTHYAAEGGCGTWHNRRTLGRLPSQALLEPRSAGGRSSSSRGRPRG